MPQLNHSARRYVDKISALYDRAMSLVARRFRSDSRLQMWEWHCASAQACVEEAALMYAEGLEALLSEVVTVNYDETSEAAQFHCLVGPVAGPEHGFRVCQGVLIETPEERAAVERLFGRSDPEILEAFAEGLGKLLGLGAFKREPSITLRPELEQEPEPELEPEILPEAAAPSAGTETNP